MTSTRYQLNNERFPYHAVCQYKPKHWDMPKFLRYIKDVLMQENVGVWKYRLTEQEHYVYIDFTNKSDMDRVIKNRKYQQVDDFTVHFNKKSTMQYALYMVGIPKGTTPKELDDILSQSYGIHEVTRICESKEDPNYLFANIKFITEWDLQNCKNTLFEVKGHPVTIYDRNTISSSSCSSEESQN